MPDTQIGTAKLCANEPPGNVASRPWSQQRPKSLVITLAAVFGVTALSKVLGFLSQILVTSLVGTTGAADTYYFSFSIVNTLSALGFTGAGFVLIPLYVEKKEREGVEQANAFANALLTFFFLALAALSLLMALLAGPLVATFGRFPATLRPLAGHVFAATAPLALLIGAGQLLMALSQARKQFVAPAFMGVLHSVVFMTALVVAWKKLGVYALVLAATVSMLVQAVVLCGRLRRGGKVLLSLGLSRREIRQILALAAPLVWSQALSIVMVLTSRNLASGLIAGSVAALAYAEALKGVFLDLCVVPVAQISLPHFSEKMTRGDTDGAWQQLQNALAALWFVVTPVVVLLSVLSSPLIQLFYQRGAFTAQSTAMTASALSLFSLGLLGEAPHYLNSRYFFALKDTSTPTWVALPFTIAYVPLLFFLSRSLQVGGISLGHSITMIANMSVALFLLRRKVRLPFVRSFRRGLAKIALSGLAMLVFSQLVFSWVYARPTQRVLFSVVEISLVAVAGIAVYLASGALVGVSRDIPAISRLMPRKLFAEMQHSFMTERAS